MSAWRRLLWLERRPTNLWRLVNLTLGLGTVSLVVAAVTMHRVGMAERDRLAEEAIALPLARGAIGDYYDPAAVDPAVNRTGPPLYDPPTTDLQQGLPGHPLPRSIYRADTSR